MGKSEDRQAEPVCVLKLCIATRFMNRSAKMVASEIAIHVMSRVRSHSGSLINAVSVRIVT